jgi:hypothetical protein
MTFDEAIKNILDAAQANYPEITLIETGYDYSQDHKIMVFINIDDEDKAPSGQCTSQFIVQKAHITVIQYIGDKNPETVRKSTAATSKKVEKVLKSNPKLDGFLITGAILENAAGEDVINGSKAKLNNIIFEGKYFRSTTQ